MKITWKTAKSKRLSSLKPGDFFVGVDSRSPLLGVGPADLFIRIPGSLGGSLYIMSLTHHTLHYLLPDTKVLKLDVELIVHGPLDVS